MIILFLLCWLWLLYNFCFNFFWYLRCILRLFVFWRRIILLMIGKLYFCLNFLVIGSSLIKDEGEDGYVFFFFIKMSWNDGYIFEWLMCNWENVWLGCKFLFFFYWGVCEWLVLYFWNLVCFYYRKIYCNYFFVKWVDIL